MANVPPSLGFRGDLASLLVDPEVRNGELPVPGALRPGEVELDDLPAATSSRSTSLRPFQMRVMGSTSKVYFPLIPSLTIFPVGATSSFPFFRSMATTFHACPRRW